jgi:copper(I)-binding protein
MRAHLAGTTLLFVLLAPSCRRPRPLGRAGDIAVVSGWAYPSVSGMSGAYLVLENDGEHPDTVLGLSGEGVGDASMHGVERRGVESRMVPLEKLPIAPRGRVAMKPGGMHIMLTELSHDLRMGDTLALQVDLARGGRVMVRLVVLPYGEIPE